MQLKEIDRNKIAEHKIRLKKHKKAIESDVSNSNMLSKEVMTQEKTANDNGVTKKKTAKKKIINKKERLLKPLFLFIGEYELIRPPR